MEPNEIQAGRDALLAEVGRVVVGQAPALELMAVALLSSGHALLEGVPGTAKTLLAQAFAAALSLPFSRIQFTPDLMPGDVIGTNVFNFQTSSFVLNRGPVFTSILLADEINRCPPKTQAALLQAMQERAVTIDGRSHDLGPSFLVVATQNPIEHEGTYPLPEAQLDRFLVKIRVGYPARDAELELVRLHGHASAMPRVEDFGLRPVVDPAWLTAARAAVQRLRLADDVVAYIVDLARATRERPALLCGASPRAASMLAAAARARAALDGRDFVLPDDVKALFLPVLGHRVVLAPGAELDGTSVESVLAATLDEVPAPR